MHKVLLINWDNYPNIASGGVYAWAKLLVESLSDFEFVVFNCLSNPNVNSVYILPRNVSRVMEIPLYGNLRFEEFYGANLEDHSLARIISKFKKTNDSAIEGRFKPIFEHLLGELTSSHADTRLVADLLFELNTFFKIHDVRTCMESSAAFSTFAKVLRNDRVYSGIKVREAFDLFSFIQRVLLVASIPLPQVDLIHSSNAWFPALAGVCLKRRDGTPLLVTEHGVAFKDLLLYHRLYAVSPSYNLLWKTTMTNVIKTIYDSADLISPVCEANSGMTKLLDSTTKTRVCYNGIDIRKFAPLNVQTQEGERATPTVVYVGRIELLKDVLNLIEAISYVKTQLPNVECRIYGSSTDLEYAKECVNLVQELQLQKNVRFMGVTASPQLAYNSGDVVVLSSVREGFPYTVIEAMSCGKAVVATNVGGVSEALANCGFLVRSRRPVELSKAILRALIDPDLRTELGARAMITVEQKFTIEKSVLEYRQIYEEMLSLNSTSYQTVSCRAIRVKPL